MQLVPGLVVDSTGDTIGIGQYVSDSFNTDWRVNNKNRPDCLIGYANRMLEPSTKLYALKGKHFWCARQQWMTLAKEQKNACK